MESVCAHERFTLAGCEELLTRARIELGVMSAFGQLAKLITISQCCWANGDARAAASSQEALQARLLLIVSYVRQRTQSRSCPPDVSAQLVCWRVAKRHRGPPVDGVQVGVTRLRDGEQGGLRACWQRRVARWPCAG